MYTSGRTVKSALLKSTTVGAATRAARARIKKLYPSAPWSLMLTVESKLTADIHTLAPQVCTVVTYDPQLPSPASLALALYELPGLVDCRHDRDGFRITITRTA